MAYVTVINDQPCLTLYQLRLLLAQNPDGWRRDDFGYARGIVIACRAGIDLTRFCFAFCEICLRCDQLRVQGSQLRGQRATLWSGSDKMVLLPILADCGLNCLQFRSEFGDP